MIEQLTWKILTCFLRGEGLREGEREGEGMREGPWCLVLAIDLDASLQVVVIEIVGIENPVPGANPAVAEAAH